LKKFRFIGFRLRSKFTRTALAVYTFRHSSWPDDEHARRFYRSNHLFIIPSTTLHKRKTFSRYNYLYRCTVIIYTCVYYSLFTRRPQTVLNDEMAHCSTLIVIIASSLCVHTILAYPTSVSHIHILTIY